MMSLEWRKGLYLRSPWRRDRKQPSRRLKAFLIQQAANRDGWHLHEALVAHRELDHISAPAEPTGARLQIRRVDKPGQGRRGQRRLGADSGFWHGAGPQLGSIVLCHLVDAPGLGEPAHPMHLDVPYLGAAKVH